ncbi:MAG TPA: deoxyribonuclease IV [Gemmatimonadaceae bacterium]
MLLGAHVSTSGGVSTAFSRAKAIGATAIQIFTKVASQWREPAISEEERAAFRAARDSSGIAHVNAHDSYLINLASPNSMLWTRSLVSFTCELRRCEALGLDALVSHPGNYIDDRDDGLARNAAAIGIALATVPGNTRLLMELTAGSGTALGSTFEEIAMLLSLIPADVRPRVGVCVDTCHLLAAGYDIVHDYDGVWRHFDEVIGFSLLGVVHLNDSKLPLESRRDRHELIGRGFIGTEPFRRLMNDPRFSGIPKVIETPKLTDATRTDRRMLRLLGGFVTPRPGWTTSGPAG